MIYSRYIIEKSEDGIVKGIFISFSSFPEEILDIGNLLCHGYQVYFSLDSNIFSGNLTPNGPILSPPPFYFLFDNVKSKFSVD